MNRDARSRLLPPPWSARLRRDRSCAPRTSGRSRSRRASVSRRLLQLREGNTSNNPKQEVFLWPRDPRPFFWATPGPLSPLPFRRLERAFRALRVAARLARVRDQAPVFGSQGIVAPRPGVGARGGALGLRVVALLQAHARELLPQARIARLDAQRALERSRSVREAPGRGIGARAVQEPGDRQALGAGRGRGQGRWQRSGP